MSALRPAGRPRPLGDRRARGRLRRTGAAAAGRAFGPLLESFVLSELARQLTWSAQPADLYHYRDHSKFEVDAVLESRRGQVVGVAGVGR
jgi:predicted AAA+ superfamily ATPase